MKHARDLVTRPFMGAAQPSDALDPRWRIINLVVALREELGLNGSDISALRGMVFLIPRALWGQQMIVHASNRVLAERSDAMNERTLRRAIQRLGKAGLLTRRDSSNRKRYRVTLEPGDPPVCFGIDLSPLLAMQAELEHRAEDKAATMALCRSLKTMIRHNLYLLETSEQAPDEALLMPYRRLLRRNVDVDSLRGHLRELQAMVCSETEMSGTDSHCVRHIQNSNPEYKEEKLEHCDLKKLGAHQLSLEDCTEAATSAMELALNRPRDWSELCALSDSLAPGLGIEPQSLAQARQKLGPLSYCLTILGLVQAIGRIANPGAYLRRLAEDASNGSLDIVRMFRSLTRKRAELGCLPG